ncbi:MAG: hypothetical protein H6R26_370 [Proteobacteria bacterium]|nr:hypothetical protein [Pseudomonadota bacterium]
MTEVAAGPRVAAAGGRRVESIVRKHRLLGSFLAGLVLSGCTALEYPRSGNGPPMAFHDTRLQYALLSDDRARLQTDFHIATLGSMTERIVSALVLPFTVATEAAFYPFAASIDGLSGMGSPPPGKTLD